MFGGYPRHAHLARLFWWRLFSHSTRRAYRFAPRLTGGKKTLQAFGYSDLETLMARLRRIPGTAPDRILTAERRTFLSTTDSFRRHKESSHRRRHLDRVQRMLYTDPSVTLPDAHPEKVDKPTMSRRIETRVPIVNTRSAAFER